MSSGDVYGTADERIELPLMYVDTRAVAPVPCDPHTVPEPALRTVIDTAIVCLEDSETQYVYLLYEYYTVYALLPSCRMP